MMKKETIKLAIANLSGGIGIGDKPSFKKGLLNLILGIAGVLFVTITSAIFSSCSLTISSNETKKEIELETYVINYIDGQTDTLDVTKFSKGTSYITYYLENEDFGMRVPYESMKNFKRIK